MKKFIGIAVIVLLSLITGAIAQNTYQQKTNREKLMETLDHGAMQASLASLRLAYYSGVLDERVRCEQIYDVSISDQDLFEKNGIRAQ